MDNYPHDVSRSFDFSLDAQDFRDRLDAQLRRMQESRITELDDDDLDFVSAAGMPRAPKDDPLR